VPQLWAILVSVLGPCSGAGVRDRLYRVRARNARVRAMRTLTQKQLHENKAVELYTIAIIIRFFSRLLY